MRIYIFKAENGLHAFAGDAEGTKLPQQFQPWSPDGFVENGRSPPHSFSRFKIETAIKLVGFQLWKMKEKEKV